MRVLYISNFLNLHQTGLWDQFIKNDVEFNFLSTAVESSESNKPLLTRKYNVLSLDMTKNSLEEFMRSFDVIIIGACVDKRIFSVLPKGKIYFHNSEHYWKKYNTPISLSKRILRSIILRKRYHNIKPYLLANSSHLLRDFERFGIAHKECFKFGYFPPVNDNVDNLKQKNKYQIAYIGRLLSLKRVEKSALFLNRVSRLHPEARLRVFGEGPDLNRIKKTLRKMNLEQSVSFQGFLSHDKVLDTFCNTDIFVFSSNQEEGWGATVNESLSCGCIVLACTLPGSSSYLIKDSVNGFLWKDDKEFLRKIDAIMSMNEKEIKQMRLNAFHSINDLWNAKNAANRLFEVIKAIYNNEKLPKYDDGPMSLDNVKK
jgi:glycosyltransferase involved in cell wall biosynthesis